MSVVTIKIEGLEALKSMLSGKARQIRFATALALTRTVKLIEAAEKREIVDVFDRPTPNTLSSIYVVPATVSSLTAKVGIKNFAGKGIPASKYLAPQITGGGRHLKRFEKALQSVGALPQGYRAVPGSGAKMDAYGNMLPSQIVQILSFFKAFPESGYKANMSDKRRASLARGSKTRQGFAYFVGRPGDRLPLGVWQRFGFARGSAIKPVLIFVTHAVYQAIFDFEFVARSTFAKTWQGEFDDALATALRTAR